MELLAEDMDEVETRCEGCYEPLDPEQAICFEFGEAQYLCQECSLDRGGSYSRSRDCWTQDPQVSDLTDE